MVLVRFPEVHSNLVASASPQVEMIVKLKHILKEVFIFFSIFFMGGMKKRNNLV